MIFNDPRAGRNSCWFVMALALLGSVLLAPPVLAKEAPAEAAPAEAAPAEAAPAEAYQELQLLTDVLSLIQKSYVEEVDLHSLIEGGINGMLDTLDPHSGYLSPEMYREMKIDTRGEFGGLGIEITLVDGLVTVVAPIEDTPADRAGIQAGDQIVRIEGQSTKNLSIIEAVKLMRGPAGKAITISVMREGFDKPRDFSIVREVIKVKSVKAKLLDEAIGYVRLVQFQERSADELAAALDQLRSQSGGSLAGLILDLRNNPGGLLDQAVRVSDLFLKEGLIVYTEGRDEGSQMSFSAHRDGTEPNYPLVLLINGGSASASEIVAGALHDQRRALLLGTQSFGKGSVQTIIPLSDGSGLRLTTARYFTPSGTSIQARGILPDVEVAQRDLEPIDNPEQFREENLEHHFTPSGESSPAGQREEPTRLTAEDRQDFQLMRALDLLKGMKILSHLAAEAP